MVNLAAGSASGFTSIAGIENVTGGSGNDTLTGDGLVNNLNGGAGNDTLDGGLGNDTLVGGQGDDTYFANNGDILNEGAGAGSGVDSVFTASNTFTLAANVENLTFTGVGNFAGTGNASNNVITGGAGNDALNGAGGADTLIGGAGNDVMNGGAGNDMFVFAAGFGNDIISGFDANPGPSPPALNQDLLDISGLGITALNFAARVTIADLGADTLVTIDGTDNILLLGVNGVAAKCHHAAGLLSVLSIVWANCWVDHRLRGCSHALWKSKERSAKQGGAESGRKEWEHATASDSDAGKETSHPSKRHAAGAICAVVCPDRGRADARFQFQEHAARRPGVAGASAGDGGSVQAGAGPDGAGQGQGAGGR